MFPRSRCDNRRVYREIAPPPDLADHVACVWTSVSRGGVIFPDGCVDIVWRGDALVVAGPATGPVAPDVPVGEPVFGVRFRLGVGGRRARAARRGVRSTSSVPRRGPVGAGVRRARGGGRACARWSRSCASALVGAPLDAVARAAALGVARPGARVAELGAALGLSERQLRRRFADAVGYGPKTLARVLRFQRFLRWRDARGALASSRRPGGLPSGGLRRPGAPDAREPPAGGPHAA